MVKISGSINYNGVGIIITILILYWLFKIDKCLCTHIPEGKYLKEWFIFDIIFSIGIAFTFTLHLLYVCP